MKFVKLFILFCIIQVNIGHAQPAAERRAQELITALNKTEFVQQYQQYKASIELDIAEFKLMKDKLQDRDVKRVQLHFNQSRLKFDAILNKLENDLSNRTTRRNIAQNPDQYTKTLQTDLTTAVNYYNENCKKLIETLLEKDSAMDVEAVQSLFSSVMGLIQLFKSNGENANQITVEYLEKEFIQPLRLKKWEEIE